MIFFVILLKSSTKDYCYSSKFLKSLLRQVPLHGASFLFVKYVKEAHIQGSRNKEQGKTFSAYHI
uniref:Uncharacterized protein n=1 Tax=Solanum lycopersicum TaxID=4081 RepID=A0A3Q7IQZ6_SOLLC